MNWDNKTVLTFIELYQINNCIWNPQNEFHKNRQSVNNAWNNIKENLGMPCTIKDLKKKKESLMSAYRGYKLKIKKSESSATGEVYRPTWFAFPLMDSFLGSVFTGNNASYEGEDTDEVMNMNLNSDSDYPQEYPTRPFTSPSPHTPTPSAPKRKLQDSPPELIYAKNQMNQALNFMKSVYQQSNDDECSIFGLLIAKKLGRLSEERRDVMMVKINQLFIDERQHNHLKTKSTIYTPSPTTPPYARSSPTYAPTSPSYN